MSFTVYLQTRPDVAFARVQKRSRAEERQVTLEYLESLHELHESWLGRVDETYQAGKGGPAVGNITTTRTTVKQRVSLPFTGVCHSCRSSVGGVARRVQRLYKDCERRSRCVRMIGLCANYYMIIYIIRWLNATQYLYCHLSKLNMTFKFLGKSKSGTES